MKNKNETYIYLGAVDYDGILTSDYFGRVQMRDDMVDQWLETHQPDTGGSDIITSGLVFSFYGLKKDNKSLQYIVRKHTRGEIND